MTEDERRKIIGERLRELRGKRTQQQVADALNVTKTAISQYERGARVPTDDLKMSLAKYYRRSVNSIFFTF